METRLIFLTLLFYCLEVSGARELPCIPRRTGILEIPTNSSNIFLYFVTDIERSVTGPQLLDMVREMQKTTPETHTAYIPIWWLQDKVSNAAKGIKVGIWLHLRTILKKDTRKIMDFLPNTQFNNTTLTDSGYNALDAESLFSHGGFGDLAMEDVEPSAEYSRKLTSCIQHFDMVTVFNQPDTSNIQKIVLQSPPFNIAHIKCPFTVVIYDNKKKMPVYFGRIVTPKVVVDLKTANIGENPENKPGPSKWCRLL